MLRFPSSQVKSAYLGTLTDTYILISLFFQEGPGPEGHRGARVVWVCDGKYLLVSGFDRYWKCQRVFKQAGCRSTNEKVTGELDSSLLFLLLQSQ